MMRSCFIVFFLIVALQIVSAQNTEPWKRHAIDNTLLGADGVRLEDANKDGLSDIVTGWEQSGLVRIYFHPGKEKVISNWPYVTVGPAKDVEDAVLVDLDGDGSKDVVSCSEGNTKQINVHWAPAPAQNYYDSSLWKTEVFPISKDKFQWMFAVPLQIDGKNGIDLVVGGKKDNNNFPQPYIGWLKAPANPRNLREWQWVPLAKVTWVMSIIIADINGDQLPDILYSDRKGIPQGARWLENPGIEKVSGAWKNHAIGDTTKMVLFLDLNDLDNDGKEDVVVVTREDKIHFIRKLSKDGLQWQVHKIDYPNNVGSGKAITVSDLDRDGKKDLLISSESAGGDKSGVYYLRYKNSVFDAIWQRNEISGTSGKKYDLVPSIDLDQDGDLDVVSTEENNNSEGNIPGLGIIWYENPKVK